MDKFVRDLRKYDFSDIISLAKYYHVPIDQPFTPVLEQISIRIIRDHKRKAPRVRANMLRGDCMNDKDYFTLEEWGDAPKVKIHFRRYDDPTKFDTQCFDLESLRVWAKIPDNYHAKWVPRGQSNVNYLRIPPNTYVENFPIQDDGIKDDVELVGIPTGYQRVGRTEHMIYRLMPNNEYNDDNVKKLLEMDMPTLEFPSAIGERQSEPINPLYRAIDSGDIMAVRDILDENPSLINSLVEGHGEKRTPLSIAALEGESDIVKLLLERGAEVNMRDEDGDTALLRSTIRHTPQVMEILLNARANPDIRSNNGIAPIHNLILKVDGSDRESERYAKQYVIPGLKILYDAGADFTLLNGDGDTPLTMAERAGTQTVIKFIRSHIQPRT